MPAKNIRVTAEIWGTGPGMGGTSYIEFKLNGEIYDVFGGGTAFDYREKLGEVKLSDGWQGRVSYIVKETPPSHEDKSPDDIVIRGAKGPEAYLLAAAWSGETGAQFAGLILELDEAEVEKFIELTKDNLAGAIDTVAYARFEMYAEDAEVLSEIRKMLSINCVDWGDLRSRMDANAALECARLQHERETERRIRESTLGPHQNEIEKIVESWVDYEDRNGRVAGPGLCTEFKKALEDYVVRENRIPSGIFVFGFSYKTSTYSRSYWRNIEVDLDAIKPG